MIQRLSLNSMSIPEDKKAKLKEFFPEVFSEEKIDFDKLKTTLGEEVDNSNERFGLTWAGKGDCFKVIQEPSIATLKPCKEESMNWDETDNLFIEGDNLEVLKQCNHPSNYNNYFVGYFIIIANSGGIARKVCWLYDLLFGLEL